MIVRTLAFLTMELCILFDFFTRIDSGDEEALC